MMNSANGHCTPAFHGTPLNTRQTNLFTHPYWYQRSNGMVIYSLPDLATKDGSRSFTLYFDFTTSSPALGHVNADGTMTIKHGHEEDTAVWAPESRSLRLQKSGVLWTPLFDEIQASCGPCSSCSRADPTARAGNANGHTLPGDTADPTTARRSSSQVVGWIIGGLVIVGLVAAVWCLVRRHKHQLRTSVDSLACDGTPPSAKSTSPPLPECQSDNKDATLSSAPAKETLAIKEHHQTDAFNAMAPLSPVTSPLTSPMSFASSPAKHQRSLPRSPLLREDAVFLPDKLSDFEPEPVNMDFVGDEANDLYAAHQREPFS